MIRVVARHPKTDALESLPVGFPSKEVVALQGDPSPLPQHWAASGEQQAASGGSGWQQGGSRVETLPDHGRCCFVGLLGCLLLTDGVCDDVLDVVKGIAGETVIELMREEKGIIERYSSDKKM
jgi:hypothetical protein